MQQQNQPNISPISKRGRIFDNTPNTHIDHSRISIATSNIPPQERSYNVSPPRGNSANIVNQQQGIIQSAYQPIAIKQNKHHVIQSMHPAMNLPINNSNNRVVSISPAKHQVSQSLAQQPYSSNVQPAQQLSSHYQPQFQSNMQSPQQQQQQVEQIQTSQVVNPYNDHHQSETCPTHGEYVVTNICCSPRCMEPLCPKCIKSHIALHTQTGTESQLEHIDDKRQEAIQELANDRINLERERELLGHFNEQGKQELIQLCHQKLQDSKNKVFQRVESFFQSFEGELSKKISEHKFSSPGELNQINSRLNNFINVLYDMESKMQSNQFISELLKVLTGELGQQYVNIHEEVDEAIDGYIEGLVNLGVDESKLDRIDEALTQYVMIEPYQFDHDQIADKRVHRAAHQQYKAASKNQFYQKNQNIQGIFQDDQSVRKSNIQARNPYNGQRDESYMQKSSHSQNPNSQLVDINMQDYFDPECNFQYLHFFQDNSKTIKFIDLKGLSKDPNSKQFKSQDLDILFKIPMYSRSIISPQGDIILTGGLQVEQRNQPTNQCYVVDYKKSTLKHIPGMHRERSSHGICFMNNHIYVVGGEDKEGPTQHCEKFDLDHNRWIEICPLNTPSSQCSIAAFNNNSIYKFGGKQDAFSPSNFIERYDTYSDTWSVVNYQCQIEILARIPNLTQSCQINENEILIMGGNVDKQNQNHTIIFRADNQNENSGFVYSGKSLPREGTFWYAPIIQQNVIFTLQNIPIESNQEHSYFGKKHFFAFQGKQWKELA